MHQVSQVRALAVERSDLHAAEGIAAAIMLSAILWTVVLLLLH